LPIRLSLRNLEQYDRDGFIIIEDLLDASEVTALCQRLQEYTHGGRENEGLEAQIEPQVLLGELAFEHPGDGIRKIDGLVEHDDLFQGLGLNENIVSVVSQIIGGDLKMFRNSLLLKPPGIGSAKGMHQDSAYWPIVPMELCSCWFALDDATTENGCMEVIPGWHKRGALPHQSVTDDYVIPDEHIDYSLKTLAPIKAGGGLFFHSLLPHCTAPNRSQNRRRAIALSYMAADSKYTGAGESPVYFPVKGRSFSGCIR